jgi:hypothetical protein
MLSAAQQITVQIDTGISGIALALAILGLLISFGTLVWNLALWRLTLGRIKTTLSWAARAGTMLFTMSPSGEYPGEYFATQGATTPALAVRVQNVGRSPVFVDNYMVHCESGMQAGWVRGTGSMAGIPTLPLKLEPGDAKQFFVDLDQIYGIIAAGFAIGKLPKPVQRAWMIVELGDGRTVRTKKEVVLRAPDDLVKRATDQTKKT